VNIPSAIEKVVARRDLESGEMEAVMRSIMQGEATPAQIAGLLVALRMKGESVDEIAASARVMRDFATRVVIDHPHMVDIVGTGGDGSHTFNISTTAAFVIAAAGAKVAKHHNRSVSSRSGSADVLELAGVTTGLAPDQVARCINEIGVGFMFAPVHHGAMRHAVVPRRELGIRTLFNLLGPLTNPASVVNQLIGVYAREWVAPIARVAQKLGGAHVFVVHSEDGLDEISLSAPTFVAELRNGAITEYRIAPEQFGLSRAERAAITVSGPAQSLKLMHAALDNRPGAPLDIVLLNAGAALCAAGIAQDLPDGIEKARAAVASGAARAKLEQLIRLSRELAA